METTTQITTQEQVAAYMQDFQSKSLDVVKKMFELKYGHPVRGEHTAREIYDMICEDGKDVWGFENHKQVYCPHCGIHLSNGIGEHLQDVNGKKVRHEKYEYECLACGEEFGPAIRKHYSGTKLPAGNRVVNERSSTTRPCKQVWHIADAMPGAKRKEVIEACQKAGIAFYTARTQYQSWLSCQKEMAADRAARAQSK